MQSYISWSDKFEDWKRRKRRVRFDGGRFQHKITILLQSDSFFKYDAMEEAINRLNYALEESDYRGIEYIRVDLMEMDSKRLF